MTDLSNTVSKNGAPDLAYFSYIFGQSPMAMATVDSEGRILRANRKLCEIFGYAEGKMEQIQINTLTYPEDKEVGAEDRANFFGEETEYYQVTRRYIKKNGDIFWGTADISRLRDHENNGLPMLLGTFKDITDKKRINEQLAASEKLFSNAFSNAGIPMALVNDQGKIEQINAAFCTFLGYSASQITGMGFQQITYPEDLHTDQMQFDSLMAGEIKGYALEKRYIHASGEIRWGALSVAIAREESGEISQVIAQVQNIHAQKLAEQLREKQNKLYTGIFSSAFTFMALLSPDADILDINENAVAVSGIEKNKLVGVLFDKAIYFKNLPEEQAKLREAIQKARQGELTTCELMAETIIGQITVDFSLRPLLNEDGKTTQMIAEGRDITHLKESTRLLEQQTQELQRQNQELQDFTHIASHDMQEPVRKIQTFGQRLADKEQLSDRGKDYLNRMNSSAQRMQQMIQDLLTYSRVGTSEAQNTDIDLNKTLKEVIEALSLKIEDTGAKIESDELPTIQANPLHMHQLFQNMMGNALKFRVKDRDPHLQIRCSVHHKYIELSFIDNGIGLRTEFANKIFQPFQRLHGRKDYAGSGIGLAICRKIIERHHGKISVQSILGEGTTFLVQLPFRGIN